MENARKIISLPLFAAIMAVLFITCGRKGPELPPDTTAPTITSTKPAEQGVDVPLNTTISVTFSEPVDKKTIVFTLADQTSTIPVTMSYSGMTAVLTPENLLAKNTLYSALVSAGVKDLAGNKMVSDHSWYFMTGATTTTPPGTTHTITASVSGSNGTISPAALTVQDGSTGSFTITPNANYHIVTPVGGTCGGSLSGTTYTTNPVTADCTVIASFAVNIVTHTVTASVLGGHGTITPSTMTVNDGSQANFTITPDPGYHATVTGCGGTLSADNIYTTAPITANCIVTASFDINTYSVTASVQDGNGTISPSSVTVNYGATASFTVKPATGYHASVTGCGGTLSADNIYTTAPITANCAVTASFDINTYTVTASVDGGHGTITPATVTVNYGSTASFTVTPETGYRASVTGCGGALSINNIYTTAAIKSDCTVTAKFVKITAHSKFREHDWLQAEEADGRITLVSCSAPPRFLVSGVCQPCFAGTAF